MSEDGDSIFERMYDEIDGEDYREAKDTLSSISPDVEWLLSTSIKYQLMVEQRSLRDLHLEPASAKKSQTDVAKVVEPEVSTETEEEEEEEITETEEEQKEDSLVFNKSKLLNPVDSKKPSLTVIPDVEWLLIPSIKYKLLMDGEKKESRKASDLSDKGDNCDNVQLPPEDPDTEAIPRTEDEKWIWPSSIKYNMMIEARRNAKLEDLRQKCLNGGADVSLEEETGSMEQLMLDEEEEEEEGEDEEHAEETEQSPPEIRKVALRDLEDIRWFAYILNIAHRRRPSFVPRPKESWKRMRNGADNVDPISTSYQLCKTTRKPKDVVPQKIEWAEGSFMEE